MKQSSIDDDNHNDNDDDHEDDNDVDGDDDNADHLAWKGMEPRLVSSASHWRFKVKKTHTRIILRLWRI